VVGGKIYVMGGRDNSSPALNTFEVFDPSSNTWTTPSTMGSMTGRSSLTAAVVDDKIYAIGGYNGAYALTTLEVYDPTQNMWNTPATTGKFTARDILASSVVNGKIYTMGGENGDFLNTLEVFDPVTGSWSTPTTTGTFTPRSDLTSEVVNGKIYTFGGTNATVYYQNTLEVFDPATNAWSTPTTTGTFTGRADLTASAINNKIYVIGGRNMKGFLSLNEVFTPQVSEVKTNLESKLEMFPNPTNGLISISGLEHDEYNISVRNILGESVLDLKNPPAPDFTLDLSKLLPGTYYIRFASANSVVTKKVVRE
jgi:N-acetylneuraminic acid mutarotase